MSGFSTSWVKRRGRNLVSSATRPTSSIRPKCSVILIGAKARRSGTCLISPFGGRNISVNKHKKQTRKQWNENPCGIRGVDPGIIYGSLGFFDEVKKRRYELDDTWIKKKINF